MSVLAMAWAWGRQVGSPSAKLVLMCLADFANQDGECFPSICLLGDQTEQSASTVRRRLQELEELGLIERKPQFRENGSRTVDLIRLVMEPPVARERGTNLPPAGPPKLEGPALPDWEGRPPTSEKAPLPTVGGPEPSFEPSSEPSPLPPERKRLEGGGELAFDEFRSAYGSAAIGASWSRARTEWARLPEPDQAEALRLLPRYLDHCRSQSRKVCHPATYLAERRWESFADLGSGETEPRAPLDAVEVAVASALSASRDGWIFVPEGGGAWAAWRGAFAHARRPLSVSKLPVRQADGSTALRRGRYFPTPLPPSIEAAAHG